MSEHGCSDCGEDSPDMFFPLVSGLCTECMKYKDTIAKLDIIPNGTDVWFYTRGSYYAGTVASSDISYQTEGNVILLYDCIDRRRGLLVVNIWPDDITRDPSKALLDI